MQRKIFISRCLIFVSYTWSGISQKVDHSRIFTLYSILCHSCVFFQKWRQRYYILYSNGSSVQLQHFDSAAKAMKTGRTTSTVNNDTVELVAALYSHPKHDNVILVQLKDGKEIYLAAGSRYFHQYLVLVGLMWMTLIFTISHVVYLVCSVLC